MEGKDGNQNSWPIRHEEKRYMATALKDFLRQHAEKHQAEETKAKAMVEEWRDALERLFAQIRAWLKESDPGGVIEVKVNLEDVREPSLGRYRVPRLDLDFFGQWIGVIPKARKTVGVIRPTAGSVPEQADGRVDITDELRSYVLYRSKQSAGDVWFIDGLTSDQKAFDQDAFERVLMSYLR
jgi:hypothetical protein